MWIYIAHCHKVSNQCTNQAVTLHLNEIDFNQQKAQTDHRYYVTGRLVLERPCLGKDM